VRQERQALQTITQRLEIIRQAQSIVQKVAETVQNQAHNRIASVVSRCLESVFGSDAYQFKIKFERKRGRTEAVLLLERNGIELDDPINSAGGGVIDVAAFALRVACLALSLPKRRKLLVLDEPFKHVSAEYRPTIRTMVESLARDMGIQFVIVTHSDQFKIGKVIELE